MKEVGMVIWPVIFQTGTINSQTPFLTSIHLCAEIHPWLPCSEPLRRLKFMDGIVG